MRDAVEYIESGGGDVTAKDGNETIFNSKQRVRNEDVPDELTPNGTRIQGVASTLKMLLRR